MATFSILEHLDVLEQIGPRLASGAVANPVRTLPLDPAEEAFHESIVIEIRRPAHGAFDAVPGKLVAEVVSGVLADPIRVVDYSMKRMINILGVKPLIRAIAT